MESHLKTIEIHKAQKVISKIESGNFDENDVDNLFMRLRAYSKQNHIFREIADFVAHNDQRNKGLANDSLEAFYLSFKYFVEYISPKTSLDIFSPFPIYVKKLMKYQVDKCKGEDLKANFNVSKQRLKSRIDTLFSENKKNKTAVLKKPNISENNFNLVKHLLGFIGSQPAFDQSEIICDTLEVINLCKLTVDKEAFLAQSDKITLCILLLIHDAEFKFGGYKPGLCKLSCEKTAFPHNVNYVDVDGNPVDVEDNYGKLQIQGHVIINKDGKDLTVCFPLMSSDLDAEKWCDGSMFCIEPLSEEHSQHIYKKIKFDGDLVITDSNRIGTINA
jgi:hypothetical protein